MQTYASVDGVLRLSRRAIQDYFTEESFERFSSSFAVSGKNGDFPVAVFHEDEVWLPRTAVHRLPPLLKERVFDDRTLGRKLPAGTSLFVPRKGQEVAISVLQESLEKHSGGILQAGCGSGKTVCACELILRTGVTACVIVHEDYLMDQFKDALASIAPHLKVGFLKRDHIDTGADFDVVLCSTQSLTSKTRAYPQEFFKSFGMVVFDEVHLYGADVWHLTMGMFPAKYRLGLTATPDRSDGYFGVIESHIGKIAHSFSGDTTEIVVSVFELDTEIDRATIDLKWASDVMKKARAVSLLCSHPGRQRVLAGYIKQAFDKGRRFLGLSDRLEQLQDIESILVNELGVPASSISHFVGGMKDKADRCERSKKPIILATYKKASVGLDIPELDVLAFLSPRADIRQAVGRTARPVEGKVRSVVFDFWDSKIPEFQNLIWSRRKYYKELGCKVS